MPRQTNEAELRGVIQQLYGALDELARGKTYTAYREVTACQRRLSHVKSDLAHKSKAAAMDFGCAVRLPDKTIAIIE